ncbi:MAG: hypothetical protein ACI86H_002880, partial [bacterium]
KGKELLVAQLAINRSGVTLFKAIEIVKSKYSGVVYEYELDDEGNTFVHEIEIINLAKKLRYDVKVDVKTGKIIETKSKSINSWFGKSKRQKRVATILKAKFNLLAVLQKIKLPKNEIIKEIEFEEHQGIQFFEIKTYSSQGKKRWLVDITGKTIIPTLKHHKK